MIDSSGDQWASGSCEANAISIHYLRTGQTGAALVALHGLMGSGAVWTPFSRALGAGFDLIMPDARGHGRSSVPPDGYSYDDHADDVCGLIQALELRKPVLIGHSMGGMTAAVVASRLGSELSGVILVDPTFISPERQREVYESDVFDQHRRFLRTARDDLISEARARNASRTFELTALVTDARRATDMKALKVLAPPNPDFRELISSIDAPVLLVLGSRGIVSPETAQELRSLHPDLSCELITDVGHAIPYDDPEGLAGVVRPFLERIAPNPF
jgi:N-formylmaleamate deformylase